MIFWNGRLRLCLVWEVFDELKKAIAAGVQEVRSKLNNIWKDEDANAFLHLAGFVKCSA